MPDKNLTRPVRLKYNTWRAFFVDHRKRFVHTHTSSDTFASICVEELYFHFKARMKEEMERENAR